MAALSITSSEGCDRPWRVSFRPRTVAVPGGTRNETRRGVSIEITREDPCRVGSDKYITICFSISQSSAYCRRKG